MALVFFMTREKRFMTPLDPFFLFNDSDGDPAKRPERQQIVISKTAVLNESVDEKSCNTAKQTDKHSL